VNVRNADNQKKDIKMSKLAIFFPGIGYTHDKPLLYYSRKIAIDKGYEVRPVEYEKLPGNVKGSKEKMKEALMIAYEQSVSQLNDIDFEQYEDILIIAKSLGTVAASKFCEEYCKRARLILYTPVEATFLYNIEHAVAFIGDSDPWSDLPLVTDLAEKNKIPLYLYTGCNHSLEVSGDYEKNIENLKNVMDITNEFIG